EDMTMKKQYLSASQSVNQFNRLFHRCQRLTFH
ncbi:hypothetical protein AAULR_21519, partial [Lacticaseibacillus rhamnosus MTCC 5462]